MTGPDRRGWTVAVSTGSFYDFGTATEDAVRIVAEHGIRDAEVYIQCETEMERPYVADLAGLCAALGVRVGSVHPYVFGFEHLLYSGYPRQRTWAWRHFERYVEICAELGARHYVSHGPPRHHVFRDGRYSPHYVDTVRRLAGTAAEAGILFCLENVSYGLIRTADEAVFHRDTVGDDIPFVLDFKSAWKVGCTPAKFVRKLGDGIAQTHLSYRDVGNDVYGMAAGREERDPDVEEACRALLDVSNLPIRHVVEVFQTDIDGVLRTVNEIDRAMSRQLDAQLTVPAPAEHRRQPLPDRQVAGGSEQDPKVKIYSP